MFSKRKQWLLLVVLFILTVTLAVTVYLAFNATSRAQNLVIIYHYIANWLNQNQGVVEVAIVIGTAIFGFLPWLFKNIWQIVLALWHVVFPEEERQDLVWSYYLQMYKGILPPSVFVGRDVELRFLQNTLKDSEFHFVWLYGPPGVGKSTLAKKLALSLENVVGQRLDAYYVNFNNKIIPYYYWIRRVSVLLGMKIHDEQEEIISLESKISSLLSEKPVLFLFDNVPKDIMHLDRFIQIVGASSNSYLIVTSRWDPNSESITKKYFSHKVEGLPKEDGILLFSQLYFQKGIELGEKDKKGIEQIVERTDGVPLAIMLLASFSKNQRISPLELSTKLNDVLWEDKRGIDLKQFYANLMNELSRGQKRAISLLNILLITEFPLEFFVPLMFIAETSWLKLMFTYIKIKRKKCSRIEEIDNYVTPARTLINTLRTYSLIDTKEDGTHVEIHALLLEFIKSTLQQPKLKSIFFKPIISFWFTSYINQYKDNWDVLEHDLTLLLRGWDWAIEELNCLVATQYAKALWQFMRSRGYWQDAVLRLDGTASICAQGSNSTEEYIWSLILLGRFYQKQGNIDRAKTVLDKALMLSRKHANEITEMLTLGDLGQLASAQGEIDKALVYHSKALKIATQKNQQREMAFNLHHVARSLARRGDVTDAEKYYKQSLELKRNLNDPRFEAVTIRQLGNLYLLQGKLSEAKPLLERSLYLSKKSKDLRAQAIALNELGKLALEQGEYQSASEYFQKSLEINKRIGDRRGMAATLRGLAKARMRGLNARTSEAEGVFNLLHESIKLSRAVNDLEGLAEAYEIKGDIYALLANNDKAIYFWDESIRYFQKCNIKPAIERVSNKKTKSLVT